MTSWARAVLEGEVLSQLPGDDAVTLTLGDGTTYRQGSALFRELSPELALPPRAQDVVLRAHPNGTFGVSATLHGSVKAAVDFFLDAPESWSRIDHVSLQPTNQQLKFECGTEQLDVAIWHEANRTRALLTWRRQDDEPNPA
jgi:hypothetical protein